MQLENRFSKLSVDTDREMCNLKSQIDSELRNLNNAVKDLQSEFVQKRADKAVDFREIMKEQLQDEMKKKQFRP